MVTSRFKFIARVQGTTVVHGFGVCVRIGQTTSMVSGPRMKKRIHTLLQPSSFCVKTALITEANDDDHEDAMYYLIIIVLIIIKTQQTE